MKDLKTFREILFEFTQKRIYDYCINSNKGKK